MKPRKAEYGNKNICGANVERIRKRMGMKQATLVSRCSFSGLTSTLPVFPSWRVRPGSPRTSN